MEDIVGAVVILGIAVRVILDVVGLFKQSAALDITYAVLFVVVGVVLFTSEGASIWAFGCIGVAVFSLMSAGSKIQSKTKSEGVANGAP